MSFTLPSHIVQKESEWYLDTINDNYVHARWIKWYCKKYWESVGISDVTGKPIKRRTKKLEEPYKSKIDWDLEDNVIIVKQEYREK